MNIDFSMHRLNIYIIFLFDIFCVFLHLIFLLESDTYTVYSVQHLQTFAW